MTIKLLFLLLATLPQSPANGSPALNTPEDDLSERFHFALRSLESSRSRLVRGSFRFSGTWKVDESTEDYSAEEGAYVVEGNCSGFGAFDFEQSLNRIDWQKQDRMRVVAPNTINIGEATVDSVRQIPIEDAVLKSSICRNSLYAAVHSTTIASNRSRNNVGITDPAKPLRHSSMPEFDIRTLGLLDFLQFRNREKTWSLHDVVQYLMTFRPKTINKDGNTLVIQLVGEPIPSQLELHINEANEFTQLEYKKISPEGIPANSQVRWTEINGVQVPSEFMIELLDIPNEGNVYRYKWNFEWLSVNEPLPARYFEYHDFPDIMNGTTIADNRGTKPKAIGVWKDGAVVAIPWLQPPADPFLHQETNWVRWFVVANLVAFAVAFVVILQRRRTRRNTV